MSEKKSDINVVVSEVSVDEVNSSIFKSALAESFRFIPSREMKGPAMSLRIAVSWKSRNKFNRIPQEKLEEYCSNVGANYDQICNFLVALQWGGQFEAEKAFEAMYAKAIEGKPEPKALGSK